MDSTAGYYSATPTQSSANCFDRERGCETGERQRLRRERQEIVPAGKHRRSTGERGLSLPAVIFHQELGRSLPMSLT
jgi:hypothetical protein